jgi:hypothetical protein
MTHSQSWPFVSALLDLKAASEHMKPRMPRETPAGYNQFIWRRGGGYRIRARALPKHIPGSAGQEKLIGIYMASRNKTIKFTAVKMSN